MKCEFVREQLSLYLYGELAAEAQADLEAHVQACAACARALAEEERLHSLLRERPMREPARELLVECRSALEEALAEEALGWRGLLRAWFGGRPVPVASRALVVLAVLVIGFGAGWTSRSQQAGGRGSGPVAASPWVGADLNDIRISNIREVGADPQTGNVRLTLDAERRLALEGTLDDPKIQRILIYTVKNYENPGIRQDTLGLLRARVRDPEIRNALIYALHNDASAGVRREALDTLSELEWDASIRQTLLQVLDRDRNPGMRVAAINVLTEHADEEIVPVLRKLARNDRNPYVRWKCNNALRTALRE